VSLLLRYPQMFPLDLSTQSTVFTIYPVSWSGRNVDW